jgi:outer membrane protein assembly factor BamB
MNTKQLFLSLLFLATAGLLSACGGRVGASSWPGVTVGDDTVYVAYTNFVYAINPSNGTETWRFPSAESADRSITFFAEPGITEDGHLIVGDYNKNLYSLDAKSGQENWKFNQSNDRYIAGPLVTERGIFAPSADGNLYALNFDGQSLWPAFQTGEADWAVPASDGERIYLPSMDHKIYAVDIQTGRQIWVSDDMGGAIVGTPALSEDGILYVGTFANELIALSIENGEEVWPTRVATDDWIWSGPALSNDILYFGDLSGKLYAINRENGSPFWGQPVTLEGAVAGTPLVTEGAIYIGTEAGFLYKLDKDGTQDWKQAIEGKIYTSPVQVDELIVVALIESDSVLIAFNANGGQAWSFVPQNE